MQITKALIIDEPWISYILDGTKTWEMRASSTSHRGWFGLIRKGSGAVVGVARLTGVGRARNKTEMLATVGLHRISEDLIMSGQVSKWSTPWFLADVRRLKMPVSYRHKNGAVTWVALESDTVAGLLMQLENDPPALCAADQVVMDSLKEVTQNVHTGQNSTPTISLDASPPISTDGIVVEINAANLRNNHFYLRSHINKFPSDVIGGSNKSKAAKRTLLLDWGGPEPAETDIDGEDKRFFRARRWVGAFYKLHDARPGDLVLIEPIGTYQYSIRLMKANLGE